MTNALRVALLTYSTRPRGGVVHTLSLAEALARAGCEVTVVSLSRGGDQGFFRRVDSSVRVDLVAFAEVAGEDVGARILRSIAVLGDALAGAAGRFDVVHAQDCISANAADALGPCLRTVHHLDAFTTPELVACHEKALVRPVAHVCVSHAVAGELAGGWGLHARVIPNGVDAARFTAAAGSSPAAVGARAAWQRQLGRYVLAVGGIEPRKGTLDLVEAMALVQQAVPATALVVAGGETLFDYRDYRAAVDARAAELGVMPVVLGSVPHDDLPSLVAGAAAFAFPSTKEGFGLAAMEALAAGVPLVTRDLPVLREVFDGAARFAADPAGFAAALTAALAPGEDASGDAAAQARRAAGTALAARHDWDTAAAEHLQLYREVLAAGLLGDGCTPAAPPPVSELVREALRRHREGALVTGDPSVAM